jgi:hypothetical protein
MDRASARPYRWVHPTVTDEKMETGATGRLQNALRGQRRRACTPPSARFRIGLLALLAVAVIAGCRRKPPPPPPPGPETRTYPSTPQVDNDAEPQNADLFRAVRNSVNGKRYPRKVWAPGARHPHTEWESCQRLPETDAGFSATKVEENRWRVSHAMGQWDLYRLQGTSGGYAPGGIGATVTRFSFQINAHQPC